MLTAVTSASMAVEVIAVNISALADAFLNNVEQAIGDQLLAVGGRPGQGSVEVQRRKPVHGRPGGFVESVPATRGEYSGGDEIVDAAAEYVKRMTVRCDDRVGLLRPAGGESRSEQARFGEGEVDVRLPRGSQPADGATIARAAIGNGGNRLNHRLAQHRHRVDLYRTQQCLSVRVVAIGRGVTHTRRALHVAQYHRVRTAGPGQGHGVIQQRLPQVAVVVGAGRHVDKFYICSRKDSSARTAFFGRCATIDDVTDQLVEMMNNALSSTIPIADHMGVQVVEARRGFAAATVPVEGNGNHFGVIYAGVQFTVAEVLGGIIALSTFDAGKYFPLVKNVDIAFRAMATTPLRAEASMDDETIARVEAEAAAQGKSDYVLDAVVTDANGTVVATTHGLYQLRAQRN